MKMAPDTPTSFQKGHFNHTITKQLPNNTSKTYLFSDDPSLIDLNALEAAFSSPLIWWAGSLSSRQQLVALVQNSYSFGLYLQPEDHSQIQQDNQTPNDKKEMIGFARLVTDYVTIAYLTDVYVLNEHQGLGLGKFMMECLHEALGQWPDLRRGLLITNGGSGAEGVYRRVFGAYDIRERGGQEGIGELIAMEWGYKKQPKQEEGEGRN
ncbi:hypothetical protein V8F20_005929 [Naviculisporaceae sp. PSN 640]